MNINRSNINWMFRLWHLRIIGYILAFALNMGSWKNWLALSISNIIGGITAILWIKYGNWARPVVRGKDEDDR